VAQLRRFSPRFDRAALAVLDPRRSVSRKRSLGGTNPTEVARALSRWRKHLRTSF
jgi:argininosuccinate lyase